jgi:16S rRNA processing protein RimM
MTASSLAASESMRSDLVVVGRVGRAHGLDGAFVVEDASADPSRFAVGEAVHVGGEVATVELVRSVGKGRLAIRLSRPAERGAELSVPRTSLPPLEPGMFYVADLVGLDVVEDGGRALGRVTDVIPAPANDVLELDSGLLLPLVEPCILDVDTVAGRVLVSRGFADDQ